MYVITYAHCIFLTRKSEYAKNYFNTYYQYYLVENRPRRQDIITINERNSHFTSPVFNRLHLYVKSLCVTTKIYLVPCGVFPYD